MVEKHETMFPIIGFLACQILEIVGLQFYDDDFFFDVHIYKPKEMSFIIIEFRNSHFCE